MDLTTGAILRRITRTELSVSAHKLATLILDGMAWKEGYNGLPRGTAAFTLSDLAAAMRVSRQHLHTLLSELEQSDLALTRIRLRGQAALWMFRFGETDTAGPTPNLSAPADSALYKEKLHKTVFAGMIDLADASAALYARWAQLIGTAKADLACHRTESLQIWKRFRAVNLRRGVSQVPAGYLLGFMRRWRAEAGGAGQVAAQPTPEISTQARDMQQLIALAPVANRQFHEAELRQRIGSEAYANRVERAAAQYGCGAFVAKLAVHGAAVSQGEMSRMR